MSAAGAVYDARVSGWIGFLEKVVEHVDGIIQVIAVRVADRYMDFPAKLRAERFPVLLEDEAKIIFLPVFDDGPVDHAGLRIPEGYRPAALASWALCAIGRVPRTPLLARHRPAIAGAHDVFHLAFMPNREFDATVHIALARPFHSLVVEVGVLVRVNVDELEPAKIYAVRAGRPHGVEEIRVKNLQRERNPAPRGPAIENARPGFGDNAELFFNVWDQFFRQRVAVWTTVIGIHLIGISVRAVAVEMQINEAWRVVGEPHSLKLGSRPHQTLDGRVAGPVASDANAKRKMPVRVAIVVLRQDDAGAQVNRAAVKASQQIGLNADVADEFVLRRKFFRGNGLRQLKPHGAAGARIEVNALSVTVEVAGSTHGFQIAVGSEKRLNVVIAGGNMVETLNWKCAGGVVDDG